MKKTVLLNFLLALTLGLGLTATAMPTPLQARQESPLPSLTPAIVQALMEAAADHWNISVEDAYDAYDDGALRIHFIKEDAQGHHYELSMDSIAIVILLELS